MIRTLSVPKKKITKTYKLEDIYDSIRNRSEAFGFRNVLVESSAYSIKGFLVIILCNIKYIYMYNTAHITII